jgi:hypothetical protein
LFAARVLLADELADVEGSETVPPDDCGPSLAPEFNAEFKAVRKGDPAASLAPEPAVATIGALAGPSCIATIGTPSQVQFRNQIRTVAQAILCL